MWLDKYREQYPELTIIEDTKNGKYSQGAVLQ